MPMLLQSFDMGSVENPYSKYAVVYHQAFGALCFFYYPILTSSSDQPVPFFF
jgi:hypothetical protein